MAEFLDTVVSIWENSGFVGLVENPLKLLMIGISLLLMYLAIAREFEPLLLLPIAFGMLLANLPFGGIIHMEYFIYDPANFEVLAAEGVNTAVLTQESFPLFGEILHNGGLADMLYLGVKLGIYPPLIFLGIGTMTDFGPLIANPRSLLLGAAAQVGIFVAFIVARLLGFSGADAAAIGIIGGADGPTAIYTASILAPGLLGAIAVSAYSYMALVPVIQPPIMKLLTTKKERGVVMTQLRTVSKTEKIVFPIIVTIVVCLILPTATPLIGMLMLGNLMRESGVVERITKTAGNELMNIITIFLGISVGCTTNADTFLRTETILILVLGLVAFAFGTAGGVLLGKLMYVLTKGKINPLIGSAGVSAVPMAARVSQKVGAQENPHNFLLMHAMGPNVAGVIGSAVAAGILINIFR
ncbi:MAG: sodium ion-translocating decarboxylase subunit beta [Ruminococcaceae bacterium]|nr:sodium ion-translocating decarboxylase subunit beta [Oscillospiraceae bacterium]